MAPWWRRVLSFSLFTPESGVDSAEADEVGSREIRFCAYVGLVSYEGMRHYRATPGALILILTLFSAVSVTAGSGSYRRAGHYPRAGRVASASAAGLSRHAKPTGRAWHRVTSAATAWLPVSPSPPLYCGKSADSVHGFQDVAPFLIAAVTSMAFFNSRSAQYRAS